MDKVDLNCKRVFLLGILLLSILAPVFHTVEHASKPHHNETTCFYCLTMYALAGLSSEGISFILALSYLLIAIKFVYTPNQIFLVNTNRAPPY